MVVSNELCQLSTPGRILDLDVGRPTDSTRAESRLWTIVIDIDGIDFEVKAATTGGDCGLAATAQQYVTANAAAERADLGVEGPV